MIFQTLSFPRFNKSKRVLGVRAPLRFMSLKYIVTISCPRYEVFLHCAFQTHNLCCKSTNTLCVEI